MKNSGVQWIGDIPEGWSVTKCKYLATVQAGYPFDSSKFSLDGGFPLIRIRDITSGQLQTYYTGSFSNDFVVKKGDLLIAMDGDFNIRLWSSAEALLNQRCCRLVNLKDIELPFLYYALPFHLHITNVLTNATTVKHLSNADIYAAEIPYPPKEERLRIIAYLDAKCGEIDGLAEDIRAEIATLEEYKKSLITEAVTKGIRGNRPMKDSGVEWIGEIPEEWIICKLKKTSSFINGYAFDSNELSQDGNCTVVRIGDLQNNTIVYETALKVDFRAGLHNFLVQEGDVLIAMSGATVGKLAIAKNTPKYVCINQRVGIIRSSINNYLKYCLSASGFSAFIALLSEGTAQPNISTSYINNFPIPLPPASEQTEIAAYLDERCSEIDACIELKREQLATLEEYKKSVIYEYVTGKKGVESDE